MGGIGFDSFVAIDWSGAKGNSHAGIEVVSCSPGHQAPLRIAPPAKHWSREAVLDFVKAQADTRTLIGFDFGFAPPFLDQGFYLPDCSQKTAPEFWDFVDEHARDEDLGASGLVETTLRPHFYFGASCGERAPFARLRQCEALVKQHGLGTPSSLFVCIGGSQVGKASFAGMRVLRRLRASGLAIWPFDPLPAHGPVVVEIFPRLFIRHAGKGTGKLTEHAPLNAALAILGSDPVPATLPLSADLTDALVGSAGLRHIAGDLRYWRPADLTPALARTEGWIFGVS